jgi:hypothetical protein
MASESDNDLTFKPGRRLCPDGSCIGIIGDDGRCTECGTRAAGEQNSPAATPSPDGVLNATEVESNEPSLDEPASGFDPNRRLCGDDACIGVIGEDNRCRVCGKPAAT